MFSPEHINSLAKEVMARLGGHSEKSVRCQSSNSNCSGNNGNSNGNNGNGDKNKCKKLEITPSQALVIAGILGGVLEVDSVLVDKDQTVQIILEGSLKVPPPKTPLEEMLDEIGSKPFDEVVKAMLGRLQ
ncbi:MAG: hypothetical protein N3B21_06825 [Clostridia bacterium]|nr:hypothetical protein [Clostridia bacterium]